MRKPTKHLHTTRCPLVWRRTWCKQKDICTQTRALSMFNDQRWADAVEVCISWHDLVSGRLCLHYLRTHYKHVSVPYMSILPPGLTFNTWPQCVEGFPDQMKDPGLAGIRAQETNLVAHSRQNGIVVLFPLETSTTTESDTFLSRN